MTTRPATKDLPEECRTRPGTPTICLDSTTPMDDFYAALARGEARPSGLMNLYQYFYIAERCQPGAKVLDVCCGRGLALPLLCHYAPHIQQYVGLDISSDKLREAHERVAELKTNQHNPFPIDLVECDVSEPWPQLPLFDVALYTSALEQLPYELGIQSLRHTAAALAPGATLYLSTLNSPDRALELSRHRAHVHAWTEDEVLDAIGAAGLTATDVIGLQSPDDPDKVAAMLTDNYSPGAADWFRDLAERVPAAFLDVISAVMVPEVATELLFVCEKPTARTTK